MGYTTTFEGVLKFRDGMTVDELRALKKYLDAETSGHPEWGLSQTNYIGLELTSDMGGLKWGGGEKQRGMAEAVQFIIEDMRKTFPDFTLTGTFECQGEDFEDRWDLVAEGDTARVVNYRMVGEPVDCPECGYTFAPNAEFVAT